MAPAYNVAGFISLCLDSKLAQSLAAWECLVVDDDAAERVGRFADPRVQLLRQENGGMSAARNAGLAQARGAAMLFLDGDDLLHPTALARLDAALRGQAGAVATFGSFVKPLVDCTPYPQQKPLAQYR